MIKYSRLEAEHNGIRVYKERSCMCVSIESNDESAFGN